MMAEPQWVRFAVNLETGEHRIIAKADRHYQVCAVEVPAELDEPFWCIGACLEPILSQTVTEIMEMGVNEPPELSEDDYEPEYRPRNCPSYIYAT